MQENVDHYALKQNLEEYAGMIMEVYNNAQEAVYKIFLKKKKCKKAKWLSEEGLQIDERRRKAKFQVKKERYTHLNVVLQRIARRDLKSLPQ